MSEIGRASTAHGTAQFQPVDGSPRESERWHELVAQIGAEIAAPLTAALERINTLAGTGSIDRQGLRCLRDEVESARQVGMIGQQLTRFASGRVRQALERLQLADVLNGLRSHRAREAQARGIDVVLSLQPADVVADASLLFSLLNTTLDWALANAHAQIEFTIDLRLRPARVGLACRFAHHPSDESGAKAGTAAWPGLDSLSWRLIEQTAWTMGLTAQRVDKARLTTLTLEFPHPVSRQRETMSALEIDEGFAPSSNSQPLAGSHVLVVASRSEIRVQVRDALRNMSLIVDFVNSVEEAVGFCREGLPHAIIVESIQAGPRFAKFRDEITAEVRDLVFIEIVEEGSTQMSSSGSPPMTRVGRQVLASSLPAILLFELSKGV